MIQYIVSGRPLKNNSEDYINNLYHTYRFMNIKKGQIRRVYNFLNKKLKLYGGRYYDEEYTVNDKLLELLNKNNIGFDLVLSNHFFTDRAYIEARPQIERINNKINGIICANDKLVKKIRQDFPDLKIKKSIINGVETIDQLNQALDIYDSVALSPDWSIDYQKLQQIVDKKRVNLFANVYCRLGCQVRKCFLDVSQHYMYGKTRDLSEVCPFEKGREVKAKIFDIKKLFRLGFNHFKLIPARPESIKDMLHDFIKIKFKLKENHKDFYHNDRFG